MKALFILLFVPLMSLAAIAQVDTFLYFGQTPPGNTPVVFAPGVISLDNRNESLITFSPDGKECYFTEHDSAWSACKIMETVYKNNAWGAQAVFSANYSLSPSISFDGSKLNFIKGSSVYQCSHTALGIWSAPVKLGNPVSVFQEYSCHTSNLGNMFVCSWRSGGKGGCDGWGIPYVDGQYQKAENFGFLNSKVGDCVWAPGPNEEYLIFQTRRPPTGSSGGFFNTDLYVTYAKSGGGWTGPRNLGPKINSSATDGGAWISHDGKYLFFASNRKGTYDIYWVSTNYIDSLKKTNFPPYLYKTIPDQKVRIDSILNYQMPDSTFVDDDGNTTLRYNAMLKDGSSLPSWLKFDSTKCVFSGTTPSEVAQFNIKVTATDTAGTRDSCIFNINITSSTGIEQKKFPTESILYQNYPNPFDNSTTIYFNLNKPGKTRLTIYNLAGVKMKTILDEYREAGEYKYIWNGESYSHGEYLCELQVSDQQSGKILYNSTIMILLVQ